MRQRDAWVGSRNWGGRFSRLWNGGRFLHWSRCWDLYQSCRLHECLGNHHRRHQGVGHRDAGGGEEPLSTWIRGAAIAFAADAAHLLFPLSTAG